MRISNISNFLGGANRIIAREIVKGNQVKLPISLTDSTGSAQDISSFHFTVRAANFDSSITESRGSIIINALTLSAEPDNRDVTFSSGGSVITIDSSAANNDTFILTIPTNIFDGEVPANVNTPPVVVMEVKYGEGNASAGSHTGFSEGTQIDSIRWLIVMRYAP